MVASALDARAGRCFVDTVLASGLPAQSRHPRYWSFYTFVLKRFWDSGRQPQTR